MAETSLKGLRVLDLSRVLAGPLCSQMLADHGAEVTKVEPPAGDECRHWGPPFLRPGTSAYYSGLNRNKRNICLDLGSPDGVEILTRMLEDADVLVENFKAGTMARWGLGPDELRHRFPRLIHCRITGFGVDGPMAGAPGYDAVLQAYGGLMSLNGEPDASPLRLPVPIVDMVTGMLAFSGVLLATIERERSGVGQLVDCTLLDTVVSLLHPHAQSWFATGDEPRRTGSAHPTIAPYDVFDAADGPFFIGAGNDRQYARLVAELGAPELAEDPRFASNPDRVDHVAELRPLLADRIREHSREELGRRLLAAGVPASPVHGLGDALTDPQVRHRQMVVEQDDYRGVGIPIKLDRTPGVVRTPPRAQGADGYEILRELGYDDGRIDTLLATGVAGEPPDGSTVDGR